MIIYVLHLWLHDGQFDSEPYEAGVYYYRSFDKLKDEEQRLKEVHNGYSFSWSMIHTQD